MSTIDRVLYSIMGAAIFIVALIWGLEAFGPQQQAQGVEEVAPIAPATQSTTGPTLKAAPLPIAEHIQRAIDLSGRKLAPAEQKMLIILLTQVAEKTFTVREHQEYWVALLGVESAFDQRAKSTAGAMGLGQLMPQYYAALATTCGIEGLPADTINDRFINATISACHFRSLIEQTGGIVSLALVAYNAGINSSSFKKADKGGVPVEETAGYVTKVQVSHDKLANGIPKLTNKLQLTGKK